ncbi:cytoskeleton protein RodZ [Parvibaculum indicum]|uniref:helix-turn-helix domain-containing protein n=1 Tax=Parvibaculum indicum TaxID=562969 RepID=UPI001423650B|nr:helix-turn-helix domain-containing protein [Parvibaculum indicum]NIJ43256.1 cytoskeleton protein RodZ [Parvibaculum indicum]
MSDHHDKIGAALRDARQACGLSLDEVAERIHIRPVYLQAIEAGQFELLPAVPQRLGFTRCYADFLQIDLGDDIDKLSEEVNDHVSQTDYSAPALLLPETRRGWGMYGVAAVLMALVAGSVFYFSGTQSGDVAATSAPQTSVPPAKASLPVLEDKAESPAPRAAEPAPAEERNETPAATDLAAGDEASATPSETPVAQAPVAAPVVVADARDAEPALRNDTAPAADTDEAAPAVEIETAKAKPVAAASRETGTGETESAELTPAYLASSDVFIRARPDNGGAVLGVVNRCEPLQVLGGNRYWREVERKDGTKGWVFTDYVAQRGQAGCV